MTNYMRKGRTLEFEIEGTDGNRLGGKRGRKNAPGLLTGGRGKGSVWVLPSKGLKGGDFSSGRQTQ